MRRAWTALLLAACACASSRVETSLVEDELLARSRTCSSENARLHAQVLGLQRRLADLRHTLRESPGLALVQLDGARTRLVGALDRAYGEEVAAGRVVLQEDATGVWMALPMDARFQGSSAVLAPGGRAAVARLADVLRDAPGTEVELIGRIDRGLLDPHARVQGDARALAVAYELVDLGVDADRISVVTRPVVVAEEEIPAGVALAPVELVLRPRADELDIPAPTFVALP